jgi:hypothetical protein
VPKLVWRVKLVSERGSGVTTETEVARIERDEAAGLAELGLRLAEAKRLTAALQAQIVPAQVAVAGECRRRCEACGRRLASKGHYRARFRSLFGDVPVRVRRLLVCSCQDVGEAKSGAALDLGKGAVAPELAYVTARYAALAPFGKVAALLSELLPISGTQHASTVRNRTLRVGAGVVQGHAAETSTRPTAQAGRPRRGRARRRPCARPAQTRRPPLRGDRQQGHRRPRRPAPLRLRPRRPGRLDSGDQAGARRGGRERGYARDRAVRRRRRAVAAAACGAAGPPVLDWWHAAVRFGHALRAARGLGANTADADLAHDVMRGLERAKWRLRHGRWPGRRRKPAARRGRHGRWPGCRRKPAARRRWTERETLREVAGRDRVRRRVADLPGYLERDEAARVRHVARRRRGEPIPTAVVASAVDEITAWRMDKARQMRRSGTTVQPFLDARAAVPNGTLEGAFRRRRPGFRPADDDRRAAAAAAA